MSCLWPDRGLSNGPSPKSYHSTNSTSSPSHCYVHHPPQPAAILLCLLPWPEKLKNYQSAYPFTSIFGQLMQQIFQIFFPQERHCLHLCLVSPLYVEHNNKSQYQVPQSAGTTHKPHNKQTWAQINQRNKKYLSKL